jgi:hypothetical protein
VAFALLAGTASCSHPRNRFPGNLPLRLVNASGKSCRIFVGTQPGDGKTLFARLEPAGADVIGMAPGKYILEAQCGPEISMEKAVGEVSVNMTGSTDAIIAFAGARKKIPTQGRQVVRLEVMSVQYGGPSEGEDKGDDSAEENGAKGCVPKGKTTRDGHNCCDGYGSIPDHGVITCT